MAKRKKTTGLPKPEKKIVSTETENQELKRNYRSRAEREEEIQRWIVLGVGVSVALILLVVGVAFFIEEVITPQRTVATINDETISIADFESRVRLERVISIELVNDGINTIIEVGGIADPNDAFGQLLQLDPQTAQFFGIAPNASQLWNELNAPDQMGIRVLDDMVDDILIRAEAEERGVTVSEEQIQAEIDALFGFDRESILALDEAESTPEATSEATAEVTEEATRVFVSPTPSPIPSETPVPTVTPTVEVTEEFESVATLTPLPSLTPEPTLSAQEQVEQFDERIENVLDGIRSETGMSADAINEFFEARALRVALRESMATEGGTGTFVNARHILVATEDEAIEVIDALNAGESFSALARAVSTDTGSGAQGGELDWAPTINYVDEFAEAVETAPIGEIVGPVESEFGFHIIQVNAREERELSEFEVEVQSARAFDSWLETERESEENNIETNSIWTDHVPSNPQFFYDPR